MESIPDSTNYQQDETGELRDLFYFLNCITRGGEGNTQIKSNQKSTCLFGEQRTDV